MSRLCVQWLRYGPYHLARLRAAHALFAAHGVEVVGLETASDDARAIFYTLGLLPSTA